MLDVAVERDVGERRVGLLTQQFVRIEDVLPGAFLLGGLSYSQLTTFMLGGEDNNERGEHKLASRSVDVGFEERPFP